MPRLDQQPNGSSQLHPAAAATAVALGRAFWARASGYAGPPSSILPFCLNLLTFYLNLAAPN